MDRQSAKLSVVLIDGTINGRRRRKHWWSVESAGYGMTVELVVLLSAPYEVAMMKKTVNSSDWKRCAKEEN